MEIRTCKNCALSAQERDERSGIQNASVVTTGPVCMCADLDENSDYCCKLWRREDHKRIKNILGAKIQELKEEQEGKYENLY